MGNKVKGDGRGSSSPSSSFPIVGVGASAGGLEAFERLLKQLPKNTGMAFVLVQHLDPTHASQLTGILSHATKMPVTEVTERMAVVPNRVYIIPPNRNLRIKGYILHLEPRRDKKVPQLPVDSFFRSLAAEHKNKAIGVILSGTASDGVAGLQAIKSAGGITFAQEPRSAKYYGMPQSAIAAGSVDFVLTPEEIARYLARIGNHPYVKSPVEEGEAPVLSPPGPPAPVAELFAMLKKTFGVDFTEYKFTTIHRRIKRRMALNNIDSLPAYVKRLKEKPAELRALFQDMFIGVTEFFRDPGAFKRLNRIAFPAILKSRGESPIRIWVPGCSTGEEVYSMAIALLEFLGDRANSIPIQIFGSDINEEAIKQARLGLYGKDIAKNVGQQRLRRYFAKADNAYQVTKMVRDLCVFARHDILRDAPFSHIDLVSCRNLLIYLNPSTHRKLLPLFHYALKPSGFLVLGSAEGIGGFSDLFALKDRKYKIYSRKAAVVRPYLEFSAGPMPDFVLPELAGPPAAPRADFELVKEAADQLILNHYGPPAVLVGENMEILHFRGHTGHFLEPAPGAASLNLLKMAREGLLMGLRTALDHASKKDAAAHQMGLHVEFDGRERIVDIHVVPVRAPGQKERTFLVLFEDVTPQAGARKGTGLSSAQRARESADGERVAHLKQELASTKAYLQSVIENHEATNEELRSLNEEIRSTNEELQSTTEELETANEELQSANEELNTLNEELQNRNQQLGVVNDDLLNLLNGLDLIVFMLDRGLVIRRFTPAAQKSLNLSAGDIGRPFSEMRIMDQFPGLEASILDVMDLGRSQEKDVQDRQGQWFSLQVRPYVTSDGRIDGAIVILYDVDIAKRREAELAEASNRLQEELALRKHAEETARGVERQFRVVADSLNEMISYVDSQLRFQFSNRAHEKWWSVERGGLVGRSIPDLMGPRAYRQLRPYIEEALRGQQSSFEGYVEYDGPGRRYVRVDYIPESTETGKIVGLYIVKKDMTELKQTEEKFQAVIESAPDAMVLTDESGHISLMNGQAEKLFGHKREDLIGEPVEVLLPERFRKKHVSHRASYMLKPEARPMGERLELMGQRKDGSQFPVEVSLSPLRSNNTVLTCAIIRDVTQQRALAQERKQTAVMEERNRLARDVHDTLAQGLTGIIVQLQAAEAALPRSAEDALGHCIRARDLAQANLSDARQSVLSLTEQQLQTVGLAESLKELVERLRPETEIRLELAIHGTPRRLDAAIEENFLGIARQAINNAFQHSDAKEIRVELAFEKGRVRLEVTDDGHGFDPSEVSRGFGLESMRGRARQCGGKLQVESKPGKGTRIAVAVRPRTTPEGRKSP